MSTLLLSLTSFYKDADPSRHPRLCVIFNNVSKQFEPKKEVSFGDEDSDSEETEDETGCAGEISAAETQC